MSPAAPRDHLTTYLDDAGSYDRLDPDQERESARELVRLRRACWRAALTDPAHRNDFVAIVRVELRNAVPEELDRFCAGTLTRSQLVTAMMQADPEGRVLERFERARAHDRGMAMQELRRARAEYIDARNRFMCANLRFVVRVAKGFGRHHMPLSDRVQEGNIGLLKAIDRFDPERGFRFSTYAAWWIRHAVTDALIRYGRTVRIPAHIHTLFTKARLAAIRLRGQNGHNPSLAEVAERVEAPVESVRAAIEAMELRAVSLDDPAADEGMQTIADGLSDETFADWAERIGERIDARLAEDAIDAIDHRAAAILTHRFGLRGAEVRTLRSLGEHYELSGERIRQLQNEALGQLRDAVEHSQTASIAYA
jgi:RNA polymerase sigma factor (sigma-70 family)